MLIYWLEDRAEAQNLMSRSSVNGDDAPMIVSKDCRNAVFWATHGLIW